MSRQVKCQKLGSLAAGLAHPPFPGAMGQRIYECISQAAWEQWLGHQTMLLNEYRLSALDPQARTFLAQEREKFLFGGGSQRPPGYVSTDEADKGD